MADLAKAALVVQLAEHRAIKDRMKAIEAEISNMERIEGMIRGVVLSIRDDLRGEPGENVTAEQAEGLIRSVFDEIKGDLRGQDGHNVTPSEVEALVRAVFSEIEPDLRGKDGKNVTSSEAEAIIRSVFDEIRDELKGPPGQGVCESTVRAMVREIFVQEAPDLVPDVERGMLEAMVRAAADDLAPTLVGKQGDPGLVWRGQWQRTVTYQANDVVGHRGSSWVALREVIGVEPSLSSTAWDLVAKAGTDGGGVGFAAGTATAPAVQKYTGWAQYADTQYSDSTPLVIVDGQTVTLPNNAGSKIEQYLPEGVTAFYDAQTLKITPKAAGDYNIITIRFRASATTSSAHMDFGIDIGGSQGVIFRDVKVFPKGAGVEHSFAFSCPGFSLNTFVTNGGQVKIGVTGGDIEVYGIEFQIARVHG